MEDQGSDQRLFREIIIRYSKSNKWFRAREEWVLDHIFYEASNCICNHFIMENCVIKNQVNGNTLIVGNDCINHFEKDELKVPKPARDNLKKLMKDVSKVSMRVSLLELAVRCKVLTQQQADYYLEITTGPGSILTFESHSKVFSPKLFAIRERMNKKVRYAFSNSPSPYISPPQHKTQIEYENYMIGLETDLQNEVKRRRI